MRSVHDGQGPGQIINVIINICCCCSPALARGVRARSPALSTARSPARSIARSPAGTNQRKSTLNFTVAETSHTRELAFILLTLQAQETGFDLCEQHANHRPRYVPHHRCPDDRKCWGCTGAQRLAMCAADPVHLAHVTNTQCSTCSNHLPAERDHSSYAARIHPALYTYSPARSSARSPARSSARSPARVWVQPTYATHRKVTVHYRK
jgi:hypothetical protein